MMQSLRNSKCEGHPAQSCNLTRTLSADIFCNNCTLIIVILMLSTLGKISADDILKYFSIFFQKTRFDISCKLSPMETICMKCQITFSGKNKKSISECRLLKFLP